MVLGAHILICRATCMVSREERHKVPKNRASPGSKTFAVFHELLEIFNILGDGIVYNNTKCDVPEWPK